MPKIQNWTSAKLGDSPNDLIWIGSNSCNFSCSTPVIVSLEHRKQQRSKKQFQNVTDDLSFIKSNHPQYFRTLFGVGKITEWITKGKAQNTFDFFAIPRWFIFFYFFLGWYHHKTGWCLSTMLNEFTQIWGRSSQKIHYISYVYFPYFFSNPTSQMIFPHNKNPRWLGHFSRFPLVGRLNGLVFLGKNTGKLHRKNGKIYGFRLRFSQQNPSILSSTSGQRFVDRSWRWTPSWVKSVVGPRSSKPSWICVAGDGAGKKPTGGLSIWVWINTYKYHF